MYELFYHLKLKKEEDLKRKYGIHIKIYRYEHNHEEQQTIKHQCDNRVRQSHLRLQAFVSVGDAFLFLFKYLKVNHNSAKRIKK
jgi:hypothetical protein